MVTKKGDVVFRASTPWSTTTIALLRHLEKVGFKYSPRIVDTGFDPEGREMVSFLKGDFVHPPPWKNEALPLLGQILKELHQATSSFLPPENAQWRPWFGRDLGTASVIGHCDMGPWNIVCHNQLPFALIDWEEAGVEGKVFGWKLLLELLTVTVVGFALFGFIFSLQQLR